MKPRRATTSGDRRSATVSVGSVFAATLALAASVATGFVLEIKHDAEECVYSVRVSTRRDATPMFWIVPCVTRSVD
jgi:hypothetical protein